MAEVTGIEHLGIAYDEAGNEVWRTERVSRLDVIAQLIDVFGLAPDEQAKLFEHGEVDLNVDLNGAARVQLVTVEVFY